MAVSGSISMPMEMSTPPMASHSYESKAMEPPASEVLSKAQTDRPKETAMAVKVSWPATTEYLLKKGRTIRPLRTKEARGAKNMSHTASSGIMTHSRQVVS